jgi:hypothetical protein
MVGTVGGFIRRAGVALALLVAATPTPGRAGPIEGTPPYPPSTYITGLNLDWSSYRRDAIGGDNWPTTWAADGNVYTTWGDGGGFGPDATNRAYVAIGIARLTGTTPATVTGRNLIGGLAPSIAACIPPMGDLVEGARGRPCSKKGVRAKAFTMLALGDQVFTFFTPGSSALNYVEARLRAWRIGSNDWRRAGWAFTRRDPYPLLAPAFLQAGRNYADIGDYVYAYAPRYAPVAPSKLSIQKGPGGGQIALLRVPKSADLLDRSRWQLYAGQDGAGRPRWTGSEGAAEPAFVDAAGVGWAVSATYVKALGRYLLLSEHKESFAGYLGLFEAPGPAGPWRTVAYFRLPVGQVGLKPTQYLYNFLANSFSDDGRRFTLVFTGQRTPADSINLVSGSFTVNAAAR